MTALDLGAFLTRTRALVDTAPPSTRQETRSWLVDPFLEALGWDVHAESCRTDTTVDGTHFEYVCTIDSIPALLVAVEAYDEPLDRDRASTICRTMAWTGVDRAIYTNGRQLLFLAGTSDVDQFGCQLAAIDEAESSIVHYTNDRLGRRLERHSRCHVARQLAIERPALRDSIVDRLTAVSGPTYEREFESATDRFLEGLVASFATETEPLPDADESDDGSGVSIQFEDSAAGADTSPSAGDTDRESSTESVGLNGEPGDGSRDQGSDADANESDESKKGDTDDGDVETVSSQPAAADRDDTTDDDGDGDDEYVVRFFTDRTSIGAIGHESSAKALVHAVEYCFDRGLSGVTVPWPNAETEGDERDETILNEQPVHADGTPMDAVEQLSNGVYLNTTGEAADHAARVEALASRAGLRAMVTGDWEVDPE